MIGKSDGDKGGERSFIEARRHLRAAYYAMRLDMEGIIPRGFIEHRRSARREMLLSVRSLLDAALEHSVGNDGFTDK